MKELPAEPGGFGAFLQRWGNTALTILLVGAILWLGIRWRTARAAQNRAAIMADLTTARTYVQVLENEPVNQPADYLARSRAAAAAQAGDAIALVLNSGEDAALKAEALICRGDLDWQLANFPELPGAATQPSLKPPLSSEQYLDRAAEAYQQVLSNSDYAKAQGAAVSAHFGLAAIAENRRQWDTARQQLQAVADDADAPLPLRAAARNQIAALPSIQTPLYLSSSTQPAAAQATTMPTTMATTMPATMETMVPAAPTTRPTAATVPTSAWKLGMPQPLAKSPVLVKAATQPATTGPAR